MVDHIKDGESLAVPGNADDATATALSPADIATELSTGFVQHIPAEEGVAAADRRIHFGLSGAVTDDLDELDASDIATDAPGYPPDIEASGAAAGTPGSFTPAGAVVPAFIAEMAGIVADPLTLWTVGQSVELADGSDVHWDSTAWVAGVAPA